MPSFIVRAAVVAAVSAVEVVGASPPHALAVSREVREACRQEYFDYCNTFEVGSPGLRQCMRRNQRRLSDRCVGALVASGEASPGEQARAASSRKSRHIDKEGQHARRD